MHRVSAKKIQRVLRQKNLATTERCIKHLNKNIKETLERYCLPRISLTNPLVKAPLPHSEFSRGYGRPVTEEKTPAPFSALANSLTTLLTSNSGGMKATDE